MSGIDEATFARDLTATLLKVEEQRPDYIVPIPRKAVKLLKLFPSAGGRISEQIYYPTAFAWSPSLNPTGKRIAVVDDATIRGVQLRRHREEFETSGAQVQTYAIYKLVDQMDRRTVRIQGLPRDNTTRVTTTLDASGYRQYQQLVQNWFAPVNPLYEFDHLRASFTANFVGPEGLEFLDMAAYMGDSVVYPRNLEGPILSATVLHPIDTDGLLKRVLGIGSAAVHAKIRCYYDTRSGVISFVPMVHPDLHINSDALNPTFVWRTFQRISRTLLNHQLPDWPDDAPALKHPGRLVSEFYSYILASCLLRHAIKIRGKAIASEPSLEFDNSDHVRRFGSEIAAVVNKTLLSSEAGEKILRALADSCLLKHSEQQLSFALGALVPIRSTAEVRSHSSIFELCTDIVQTLRSSYETHARELRRSLDDRYGWSYAEMRARWSKTPGHLISQALDYLCDHLLLVPWYSEETSYDGSRVSRRCYRTSEFTELTINFEVAKDLVAYVIAVSRERIPKMENGVELTYLNKVLANVLLDAKSLLNKDEHAKLKSFTVRPGPFGPEVFIQDLVTGEELIRLEELADFGFEVCTRDREELPTDSPEAAAVAAGELIRSRLIRQPSGHGTCLQTIHPATARHLEDLIGLYISAFAKLGSTVTRVLMPLAVFRHREETYAYLHKDLSLWMRSFASARGSWDSVDERRRFLELGQETIGAFATKIRQMKRFPSLWKRFIKHVEMHSRVLAQHLSAQCDGRAADPAEYSDISRVHSLFLQLHLCAVNFSQQSLLDDQLRFGLANRLRGCGLGSTYSALIDGALDSAPWMQSAVELAASQLRGLPVPKKHAVVLREERLAETRLKAVALRQMQQSGGRPLLILMGDLVASKRLMDSVQDLGGNYLSDVEVPFQETVRHLADRFGGRSFHEPQGDDLKLFFDDGLQAFSFAGILYSRLQDLEDTVRSRLLDGCSTEPGWLHIRLKLGMVQLTIPEDIALQNRIHFCSTLIKSDPPHSNSGHLYAQIPRNMYPPQVLAAAEAEFDAPEGVVLRVPREELLKVAWLNE